MVERAVTSSLMSNYQNSKGRVYQSSLLHSK
jgi:hypothetical protein